MLSPGDPVCLASKLCWALSRIEVAQQRDLDLQQQSGTGGSEEFQGPTITSRGRKGPLCSKVCMLVVLSTVFKNTTLVERRGI